MRRHTAALALAVIIMSGCAQPSMVDPQAEVEIRGVVQDADGTPAPQAGVLLSKGMDFAGAMESMATVLSLGTFCLSPDPPDLCRQQAAREIPVGPDGDYATELTGEETRSWLGYASPMSVSAVLAAREGTLSGATTSFTFRVQTESIGLPPLVLWDPVVDVGSDETGLRISWSPPPPEGAQRPTATFHDAGGQAVWMATGGSSVTVDPRVLEDMDGGVVVNASGRAATDGSPVEILFQSAQVPLQGPGAPPSRAAACSVVGPQGAPVAYSPCPVTDGDFGTPLTASLTNDCRPDEPGPCDPVRADAIVVDLGAVAERSLVVLRGLVGPVSLDWSSDGASWSARTVAPSQTAATVVPLSGVRARYLRLRGDQAPIDELAEVSVW